MVNMLKVLNMLNLKAKLHIVNQTLNASLLLHLSHSIISFSFLILSSLTLVLFFILFSPGSLYYLSHSLSLTLSLSSCELPFPCNAGVVIPKSKNELLRKHLWLPPSLWLRSLPIFTTGPLKSWMKNDNTRDLTLKKQVGESKFTGN